MIVGTCWGGGGGLYFTTTWSCFDTIDERNAIMCAKVIWLALKSKHWKQNLAANHQAVSLSKLVIPMTLTVCGSYARLRIILHSARSDDKTQYYLFFFIFYWSGSVTVNSIIVGVWFLPASRSLLHMSSWHKVWRDRYEACQRSAAYLLYMSALYVETPKLFHF